MQRCSTCVFRNSEGYCENPKLYKANSGYSDKSKDDMLVYAYIANGSFMVGGNFGCVHHDRKENNEEMR